MANARSYPSPSVVRRFVELARDMGLEPAGFEVTPDGTLRVLPKAPPANDDDALFEKWEGKL